MKKIKCEIHNGKEDFINIIEELIQDKINEITNKIKRTGKESFIRDSNTYEEEEK